MHKKRIPIKKIALLLVWTCFSSAVQAVTFYVSPAGSDSNAGTFDAPFKTIAHARDIVDGINDSMSEDITVYLRGGTYSITNTITFDAGDGGTNGYRVIYRAYTNETPVICGGVDLSSGWSVHSGSIYKKTGVTNEFRQLYVNGETAVRARTPNKGGGYYSAISWDNDKEEIKINASDISSWDNFTRVEMVHIINWTKAFLRLSSYSTSNEYAYVDIQNEEDEVYWTRAYPVKGGWGNSHSYYFENAYEFLDIEGEWYLDAGTETLYYKPRSGESMGSTTVMAPGAAETLLKVEGTLDNPVKNLTFYGITFEHSNWLRPNDEGALDLQASQMTWQVDPTGANNMWVYRPPAGIKVIGAQGIRFERNIIRNMGAVGIDFEYGTKGCEIIGNFITQTAANGVSVGKFTDDIYDEIHAWDVAYNPTNTLEICTDDVVKNNYIYMASEYYSGCGIAAGYPKNLHIEHNEVEDCQYTGISVGYGWTDKANAMSDNFIGYNKIHNVMNVLQDGGGIYTLSKQPGTEIRGNYIYPAIAHGHGIYLDEGTGGTADSPLIVADNVLSGDSVHHNTTSGNITESNNLSSNTDIEINAGIEPAYQDILPPVPTFESGRVEAESCDMLGRAASFSDGAASGGYGVQYLDLTGDGLEFRVSSACILTTISYCSQQSGKISFYINDSDYADIDFSSNGAWSGSYTTTTANITIPAGAVCKFQSDSGDAGLNMDYFVLEGIGEIYIHDSARPTPGADDIYQFSHAASRADNAGAGDAEACYIAHEADRHAVGQSFTTGAGESQYTLSSVWLKHVTYPTWSDLNEGDSHVLRITDPAQTNTTNFVVHSESLLVVTTAGSAMVGNPGTGNWVEYRLQSPVILDAAKAYAFDIGAGPEGNEYWEVAGVNSNAYNGGGAYTSGANGTGDYAMTTWDGDRTFLLELTPNGPDVVPSIQAIVVSNGMASLIWDSEPGATYKILSKTNLNSASWSEARSGISGSGASTSNSVALSGASQEFFKIEGN